jgi:hypothetical protein
MLVIPAFGVRIWSAIMNASLVCVINSFSLYLLYIYYRTPSKLEIKNILNRLDDMLLFQDVSINDVNEVVKKIGNIFKHTSASVFGSKCKKSFCEKK